MPARPNLRPVPDAPPRAVGMIRVSQAREDMTSPEVQRTAIEDHCARRGYVLTRWVEGIDESGSRRRSPWWRKLDGAVALVEAGDADVIVVWRFSRAGRSRLRWAVAIDRVEVAGGLLESATEPLDTSTASGRLARGMLAEFAAYEAEAIGATWREAHARRTAKGLPATLKARFGYRIEGGLHRPDPDTGPVLADLYRRYVAGESIYSLVQWLNGEGILTAPGYRKGGPGPWSHQGVRRVLDAGFGAGWIVVHGDRLRGAHEPVVDADTWTAYLAARAARRRLGPSERSVYLLSGMVRCGWPLPGGEVCGSPMGGGRLGSRMLPMFRCNAVASRQTHKGGTASMHLVEAAVMAWLREQAGVDEHSDAARAARSRAARRRVDAEQLRREVGKLDAALVRLEVNRAADPGQLPHVYDSARAELLEQRRATDERRLAAEVAARAGQPAVQAARLLADWDLLSVEQRRGALRGLVGRVVVTPGGRCCHAVVVPVWHG